jgi:CRP/FNR family transcriptional regulator
VLDQIAGFTILKPFHKGEDLFFEGATVHGFFIVRRGAVKLYRINLLGKEQIIHVFRLFESFAEETVFSELGFPASARATEDSQLLLVKKHEFLALLRRHPELSLCMLRALGRHVRILVGLLADLTLKDVKTRLANWLLEQCPDPESRRPHTIELNFTKNLLAAELGAASETLSRTLAKLRARRLIAVQGKSITLLSPFKLAEFARRNAAPVEAPTVWEATAWARGQGGANLFPPALVEQPPPAVRKRICAVRG